LGFKSRFLSRKLVERIQYEKPFQIFHQCDGSGSTLCGKLTKIRVEINEKMK
jgi:hypothetical protein